jgi:hypothetical protein
MACHSDEIVRRPSTADGAAQAGLGGEATSTGGFAWHARKRSSDWGFRGYDDRRLDKLRHLRIFAAHKATGAANPFGRDQASLPAPP